MNRTRCILYESIKAAFKRTYYVIRLYEHMHESTQQAVIADMKRLASNNTISAQIDYEPLKWLQKYMIENKIFRALFYARCRIMYTDDHKTSKLLSKCMHSLPMNESIEINTNAIGSGLRIYHGPITIGSGVIIENHVSLNGGVIIGRRHGACPILHNGVEVGVNATIIGGIDIGKMRL